MVWTERNIRDNRCKKTDSIQIDGVQEKKKTELMNSFEDVIFSGKPIHVDNFFFGEVNKQYLSFGFGNVSNFVKKPIKFRYKFMKKKTHKDYLI